MKKSENYLDKDGRTKNFRLVKKVKQSMKNVIKKEEINEGKATDEAYAKFDTLRKSPSPKKNAVNSAYARYTELKRADIDERKTSKKENTNEMSLAGIAGIAAPSTVLKAPFPSNSITDDEKFSNKYRTVFTHKVDLSPVIVESFKSARLNRKAGERASRIALLKKQIEELESDDEINSLKKNNYYKKLKIKQNLKSAKLDNKEKRKLEKIKGLKDKSKKVKIVRVNKQPKNTRVKA